MPLLPMLIAVAIVAVLTTGATSVRAVSRLWLRHWIEHRHAHSGTMARYLERPMRLIHAAGTGSMLVVFSMGAVITLESGTSLWSVARDAGMFLVLLLLGGQLIPRAVGRRWAPQLVPVLVPALRLVDLLVSPIQWAAQAVGAIVSLRADAADGAEAREGLEELLRDGAFDGMGSMEELAIISGVMQFGDKTAIDVMTPRTDMFALDVALGPKEIARRIAQSGYSRVPLYRETVDTTIGMIHVFDVFKLVGERMPALRPVTFAKSTKPASELLFELLRARRQLAIVQDDDNTVLGVVTMEDLLEELVGEIRDEHDEPTPRAPGSSV